MPITSRFTAFTTRIMHAAAHIVRALADRFAPPTVMPVGRATTAPLRNNPVTVPKRSVQPQKAGGAAMRSDRRAIATKAADMMTALAKQGERREVHDDEPATPTTIAPASNDVDLQAPSAAEEDTRWPAFGGYGGAEETADHPSEPTATMLVQPSGPLQHDGDVTPVAGDDDELGDAAAREPADVCAESEIARAMRIAEELRAGRSLSNVMREVDAAMPWTEVVRIMSEVTGAPSPAGTAPASAVTTPVRPLVQSSKDAHGAEPIPSQTRSRPVAAGSPLDAEATREIEIARFVRGALMTGYPVFRHNLRQLGLTESEVDERLAHGREKRARETDQYMRDYYERAGRITRPA